jgi:hypothetical protein
MESMLNNTSINCLLHDFGLVKIFKLKRDSIDDYDYVVLIIFNYFPVILEWLIPIIEK